MTSSAKYIVYQCNVCQRETELALDGRRPDPSRCNITLKCRGQLERIGTRTGKEFLFTPLVPGLPDYIKRGTSIVAAPKLAVPNPITVYSAAGAGIISMAVVRRTVVSSTTQFSVIDENNNNFVIETAGPGVVTPITSTVRAVLFEISPELLTASRYIYSVVGPVSIVTGLDASPDSKSLRFTADNQISVFINGVEIAPSGYDRTVNDQITFTPTIFDSNNVVEVFVYKDITTAISTTKQVVLEFKNLVPTVPADLELRKLCSWGNFGATIIDGIERFTLFCTDLTGLNQDKSYGLAYFETTAPGGETRKILPSEVYFLLGKEPFAYRDKERYAYLEGDNLVNDQIILTYKISQASGQLFLTVDASAITQVFNPVALSRRISQLISHNTATASTGTALEGTENLKPKYILGPV